MEIWMDIKGYEGLYKVSNFGKIKSLGRKVKSSNGYRLKKEKILKQTEDGRGYNAVHLCKEGKCKQFRVHRIVATAFIRNPKKGEVVNHIDGNKLNNNYLNLEWCTSRQNNIHAIEEGLWKGHGVTHYLSKFSKKDVEQIRNEKKKGRTNLEISKEYMVHETTIAKIIRGESYKYY